jgi:hypothetical protein
LIVTDADLLWTARHLAWNPVAAGIARKAVSSLHLNAYLYALLRLLLQGAVFDGARELAEQIDAAKVVGGIPTLLDLEVTRSVAAAPAQDGVIPVRAFVHALKGEVEGEVMVWLTDGYLSGLEYARYSDEAPTSMPPPARVRVE